jgi:hypothetical protein
MPARQPFAQVGAITGPPFLGHPAAVCLLPTAGGGVASGTGGRVQCRGHAVTRRRGEPLH